MAVDHGKPVRIGVNGGSLNQELVVAKMQENTDRDLGKTLRGDHQRVHGALGDRIHGARDRVSGLRKDQIIISCKTSRPRDLIAVYRALAKQTDQPLHLGLTEAGMGMKGLVWSASAMGVLLNEGIGDTIRVSLTPRPGGDRREEVYAACELLQALGTALVLAERHGVSRLRPHDEHDVPGAGRTHPGLRARADAGRGRRSTRASRP